MRSGLSFLISTAAAPTFPPCADPSENTWISSAVFSASHAKFSLFSAMLIVELVKGHSPVLDGSRATAGIFLISPGSNSKAKARFYIGLRLRDAS